MAPEAGKTPATGGVLHVLGARPNFPKAAPVIRALRAEPSAPRQIIVHTGQHYDREMSDVFFADLDLPEPAANLGVGSGSHGQQTAALLVGLEAEITARVPDLVLVYGDVNSTLAAALVCAKMLVPFGHVEAGLRSFDRTMPEEVNRVVVDSLADLLFATSPEAIGHLAAEGVDPFRVHLVGNPMVDSVLVALPRLDPGPLRARFDLPERYAVATLHRPANVDDIAAAAELVRSLNELSKRLHVLVALHPRGRPMLEKAGLADTASLTVTGPLGYVDFLSLVRGSTLVVTDSGGVQEETTTLRIPCLTLRPNTERPITVTQGTNRLVSPATMPAEADKALAEGTNAAALEGPPLWDGRAGERIARVISAGLAAGTLAAPRIRAPRGT